MLTFLTNHPLYKLCILLYNNTISIVSPKRRPNAMTMKKELSLALLFIASLTQCNDSLDKLYSTAFLKNYAAVRQELIKEGFKQVTFRTEDGLILSGLFLARPNARCNVIVCAGWYPGKKEGMATFYALLPDNCNILFFDARGHGESEGSLLWQLWRYGIDEPKDITGAIVYLNNSNSLPIFIVGICSGAFNAAHAMISLEKNNKDVVSNVKGLVFDSGWGSVSDIIRTAPAAGIEKRLMSLFASWYKTKKKLLRTGYFYKIITLFSHYSGSLGSLVCRKLFTQHYEKITTLFNKMHHITSPIFFIHSYDDTYADMSNVIRLSTCTPHKKCWWIKQSFHGKHHLIHKELYKEKLTTFIDACLK